MVTIMLTGDLAERLQAMAQQKGLTVEEFLEEQLKADGEAAGESRNGAPPGTLAALAEAALRVHLEFEAESDVSERSREILEQEWGGHLNRWAHDQGNKEDE